MSENTPEPPPDAAAASNASVLRWFQQGLYSAVLMRPDWTGLRATPIGLARAVFVMLLLQIGIDRIAVGGEATFVWASLGYGWMSTGVTAWACWLVLRGAGETLEPGRRPVDVATLLTLIVVQDIVLTFVMTTLYVTVGHAGHGFHGMGKWAWTPVFAMCGWLGVAQVMLVWRSTPTSRLRVRAIAAALLVAMLAVDTWLLPVTYWDVDESDASGNDAPMPDFFKLTQEVMEAQPRLLADQLDGLRPGRLGVVDLYAITFAPYAEQDVFMRESAVVADVMESRFDARGRSLQLVNNKATTKQFAWATRLNLQRSIQRVAQRMNRDEDILFIHLTSHGGSDGHLAAEFYPLTVEPLTPQLLRQWLDEAGIRHRVISISACFSGSWIAPLASDDTLVMTAADADHTSYGCGAKSTLTFFGQAMYDEQLRHTWSFEQAHAASRKIIDQRERAAGKADGYSNPQISVGARIREPLKALEARLAASAAR
ncbi:MAG: C13 family peptidase [Burkholderiaceae bacterium]